VLFEDAPKYSTETPATDFGSFYSHLKEVEHQELHPTLNPNLWEAQNYVCLV
jgi:hypothetical protein